MEHGIDVKFNEQWWDFSCRDIIGKSPENMDVSMDYKPWNPSLIHQKIAGVSWDVHPHQWNRVSLDGWTDHGWLGDPNVRNLNIYSCDLLLVTKTRTRHFEAHRSIPGTVSFAHFT